jgi:hypothetical protein
MGRRTISSACGTTTPECDGKRRPHLPAAVERSVGSQAIPSAVEEVGVYVDHGDLPGLAYQVRE